MISTQDYKLFVLEKNTPPPSIVDLLKSHFSNNIYDQQTWQYYYNITATKKPWIAWLEYQDQVIAHYSMFYYDFITTAGEKYTAGKPELPCVSKHFLHRCIREKADYQAVNPLEILNKELLKEVSQKNIDFLFTWPNEIALNTYKQEGYNIQELPVQTFRYFFTNKEIQKKCSLTKTFIFTLLISVFKILHYIKNILFSRTVTLTKVDTFKTISIEKICSSLNKKAGSFILAPYKTSALIDKKFSDSRFWKFYITSNKEEGYIIVSRPPQEKIIKIVDYGASQNLFYKSLPLLIAYLEKNTAADSMIYRNYPGPNTKNKLKLILLGGLIPGSTFIRHLAWKTMNKDKPLAPAHIDINDFLSDFSIL